MDFFNREEVLLGFGVFFAFLVIYLYFMSFFILRNILWVFIVILYILLFIIRDNDLHNREEKENIMIKDRKEIRISRY